MPVGRPLSIAIVRARYNPFGGAERFVQRALAALSDAGVDVTVIARRWDAGRAPADGSGRGDGERAVAMRFLRVDPFHVGSVWRDAAFARGVHRAVRAGAFDLVQSHERIPGLPIYRAGDGVHASFLERRARALPGWRRATLAANPYHAWMLRTERAMFEHPALRTVICNSTMVRDEIAQRFAIDPARLAIVRNGVDLVRFAPPDAATRAAARAAALAMFGTQGDRPLLVFVGSGFERKGLAGAIRALAHPAAPRDAVLLVAGRDKHARRYAALAAALGVAARVHLLGPVDDVVPWLQAADAFVQPTLYDPFPNAALEALACGLPLVTSTGSGAAEVIEEGVSGFVRDALDIEGLAHAMSQAVSGGAAMRAAARDAVRELGTDRLGAELVALYRSLLA